MSYTTINGKPVRKGGPMPHVTQSGTFRFPKDKGLKGGSCNMSACLRPGAWWYNHGSHAHYCESCAHMLNTDRFNKRDAMELFGHDLCTFVGQPQPDAQNTYIETQHTGKTS